MRAIRKCSTCGGAILDGLSCIACGREPERSALWRGIVSALALELVLFAGVLLGALLVAYGPWGKW